MECFNEILGGTEASDKEGGKRLPTAKEKEFSLVEAAEEVDKYLLLPLLQRNKCPLQYWKEEDKFPILKKLATKHLSTPASSVYSERMYSEYGNVFEDKRSRLLPKRGEMLLFVHHNGRKYSY